jgi:hypothetical protein
MTIGGTIPAGDPVAGLQVNLDNANRGLDEVFAWPYVPLIGQRGGNADDAVATHAQVSYVIEEDNARCTRSIDRLNQKCADQNVGAARLAKNGAPVVVIVAAQIFKALGEWSGAEMRATG